VALQPVALCASTQPETILKSSASKERRAERMAQFVHLSGEEMSGHQEFGGGCITQPLFLLPGQGAARRARMGGSPLGGW
jgi:hypothetical protein